MLKFYQFEPKYGLPNVSPFCMKVETFMRMADIPYTALNIKDPRKTPKGKAPYIDDNGTIIADSSFVLEYLTQKHEVLLDRELSSYQQGIARMITGTLEERLYFALVYSRWVDETNWPTIKDTWFSSLPPIIKTIVPGLVRKGVIKSLHGQGIGRHSKEEIYAIGVRDLQGIVDLLGDQKYALGGTPTSVDATLFSFLANILYVPLDSPLRDFAKEQLSLEDYAARMGKRVFPEYKIFT